MDFLEKKLKESQLRVLRKFLERAKENLILGYSTEERVLELENEIKKLEK